MKKAFPLLLLFTALTHKTLPEIRVTNDDDPHEVVEMIRKKYDRWSEKAGFIKAGGKNKAQITRFIRSDDHLVANFGKLHQIALVRHGQPDMQLKGKFTSEEANQYLNCYDSVCVLVPKEPFFQIDPEEDIKVFSSPLNRALSTARYMFGAEKEITVSPLFREFENKIGESKSLKKKSIRYWKTWSRIRWMLGGGKKRDIESFSQAKKRAKQAARLLDDASAVNPKIVLTAHGLLNHYVKKNLMKMGWREVEDTGNGYFGTTILVKVEP